MDSVSHGSRTSRYRVVVRGEYQTLPSCISCGSFLESVDGLTVVAVDIKDSSHLRGMLDRLRDLGMDVVSVEFAAEREITGAHLPDLDSFPR